MRGCLRVLYSYLSLMRGTVRAAFHVIIVQPKLLLSISPKILLRDASTLRVNLIIPNL